MIIKIDVDGVIRNMFDNMCEVYCNWFGDYLTVNDIFDYDVDKVFPKVRLNLGISAAEFFFRMHTKEVFLLSKPYYGVKEAIERLMMHGHKVVIATWQYTFENKINTLHFFEVNDIPYDDICFTKDKWMIKADWIIDDTPEFIIDERETAHKIMINMPYNKDIKYDCFRENSLNDAVETILKYENEISYDKNKIILNKKTYDTD